MNFSKGHSGFIENIFILILIAFHLVLGLVIPISNFLSKVDMMQHHMLALGITRTWDVTAKLNRPLGATSANFKASRFILVSPGLKEYYKPALGG